MQKHSDGGVNSPVEAQEETPIVARKGRLSIAGTLKLAFALVLVAFVAFMFASYLSVHSIDGSFSQVVEVDRPSLEAATEMDDAADEAMIVFLESLVTDQRKFVRGDRSRFRPVHGRLSDACQRRIPGRTQ